MAQSPLCGALAWRRWPPVSSTLNRSRPARTRARRVPAPPEPADKRRVVQEARERPRPPREERAGVRSPTPPLPEAPASQAGAVETNSPVAKVAARAIRTATRACAMGDATSPWMEMRTRTPSKPARMRPAIALMMRTGRRNRQTPSATEPNHVADPCRSAIRSSIKLATRSARIPSATRSRRLNSRAMLSTSREYAFTSRR